MSKNFNRGKGRDRRPGGKPGDRSSKGGNDRNQRDRSSGKRKDDRYVYNFCVLMFFVSRGRQGGQKKDLQVEKRDGSKTIKKGGQQGPRKISLQKLRSEGEQGKKGGKTMNMAGKGKPGDRKGKKGGKGRDRRRDRKNNQPRDPAARAEALDRDLEAYWVKGGHQEVGKYLAIFPLTKFEFLAQARLDEELEGYFAQKPQEQAPAEEAKPAQEQN